MATSNSIQTLRLPYTYNVASKTLAVIFVSTHLKGRTGRAFNFEKNLYYKDAEKIAEKYRQTFAELNMDDIKVFIDLTKAQIIQEFDALHKLASEFKGAEGEVFSILIAYVGGRLDESFTYSTICRVRGIRASDYPGYICNWALTPEGEVIGLPEYCIHLSSHTHIHSTLLIDYDEDMNWESSNI